MSQVLADQARRRERCHPVADDALAGQIEFRWASMLEHALELADRAAEATNRVERDRLLGHALAAYQLPASFGRRCRHDDC